MHQPLKMLLLAAALFATANAAAVDTTMQIPKPTPAASNPKIGMAVNTTSGILVGHPNAQFPAVSEYLGVPFAQPPLKSLRFSPPQPFSGKEHITAAKQPASCIQALSMINSSWPQDFQNLEASRSSFRNHTSEDCLYLNVWTKFPYPGAEKKPVMVWFYGGGFHSGGVSDGAEQGAIWAEEQDVIVISPNYRLDIFGFSGAPGQIQNVGLLDQRLALEWVRDNVEAFGGDCSRITIFGHSAGSASVDLYNYAWQDDPIIAGSIIMSGTATSFANRIPSTTAMGWDEVAQLLKCGNSSTTPSAQIFSCIQSKPAKDVFEAQQKATKTIVSTLPAPGSLSASITGLFGPTVDNKTVFENYTALGLAGQFIKRPILTGNNNDEGCDFTETGTVPLQDDALLTEDVFTCPTNWAAKFRAAAGISAWQYRYFASYPNLEANVCPGQPWHGQEVYVMFGSSAEASLEAATAREIDMGWYFRNAWAAFARDPSGGLKADMGWPLFNSNESHVIELGLNTTLMTVGDASKYEKPCLSEFSDGASNF